MELTYALEEIQDIAKTILSSFSHHRCFAFYAEMGCGKTTLIKELCKQLGVKDNVSSPTYSIINEYEIDGSHDKVYHMDWYRLKNVQDAIEAGVQDILEHEKNYCFIEWTEIAPELLPKHCLRIEIKMIDTNTRSLKID